ncbi:hypothetical protein CEUSTIGMA_g986.t1 [Chlamydomonas eustigma]|uniref:Uncharacterized protein n=1 Tax=Chlamydomonas eustigma TaxID=1157962 RepID=A0A250WRS6_9CHLO|nr:hypothetical protein CEUSTIGMA_g986.t1 [Chlamydomonas eustigma]|eukprot:GAX73535.1 hypothetical protein CEUSTIGMA_g986.t1 [Chlamydomonas eustigma]
MPVVYLKGYQHQQDSQPGRVMVLSGYQQQQQQGSQPGRVGKEPHISGGVAAAARPAAPPLHCIAAAAAPVPPLPNCRASTGGVAAAARPAVPPLHCIVVAAAHVPPLPNCRASTGGVASVAAAALQSAALQQQHQQGSQPGRVGRGG